jgi:hypothetical protein
MTTRRRGPYACLTPGCGLVYTPGYWREHVKAYHRKPVTYYKAVRPDGTDFRTGTINYAAALGSGEIIRHPSKRKTRNEPSTYLSVSVEPADCTGFQWPCRLFRVEPVGRVMENLLASRNKRAVSALRVVEELPAHMAFGPNGEAVAALIERAWSLTEDEWSRLDAASDAVWDAPLAWDAARDAAWDAARARQAAWDAACYAARAAVQSAAYATWDAARDAAPDAAVALMMRDKITPEQFDLLYGPWASVIDKQA